MSVVCWLRRLSRLIVHISSSKLNAVFASVKMIQRRARDLCCKFDVLSILLLLCMYSIVFGYNMWVVWFVVPCLIFYVTSLWSALFCLCVISLSVPSKRCTVSSVLKECCKVRCWFRCTFDTLVCYATNFIVV